MPRRCGLWARHVLVAVLVLAGCSSEPADRISVALNWKPEPEFGGLYEALESGAFARRGLEVEITGGPGAPVAQMVAAGQASFGIASADEVLITRDRGADVVAVFATYQTSPQGIMVHASRKVESLEALFRARGKLAVEPGLPYVRFLQKKYQRSRLNIVPYTYSIAPFLSDPKMAQQVFITSEPIAARRAGAEPRVFLIADAGYNPYTAVIITRGARLREEPARVAAFVEALREGWRGYLDDATRANRVMGRLNAEMDAESFRLGAAAQAPLIEDAHTRRHGLGSMTRERWAQLAVQLHELGMLDGTPDPDACFADVEGLAARSSAPSAR